MPSGKLEAFYTSLIHAQRKKVHSVMFRSERTGSYLAIIKHDRHGLHRLIRQCVSYHMKINQHSGAKPKILFANRKMFKRIMSGTSLGRAVVYRTVGLGG